MADKSNRPIIIKKKKISGGGHHGGGWKVAYADFVTAMMAFFLLLWLLNVTTKEQKDGIASFFEPASISRSFSGSGGVLGGQSIMAPGAMVSTAQPMGMNAQIQRPQATDQDDEDDEDYGSQLNRLVSQNKISVAAMRKAIAEREDQQFKDAEAAIKHAIETVPELKSMAQNMLVDETEEGLRIQIIDQDRTSMFPMGSSQMYDNTRKLLGLVAQTVRKMPNKISIRGHTDSVPYREDAAYNNWELSADRANASRRALISAGIPEARISNVVGKADREPLYPQKPQAAENRRISVILLRDRPATGTMRAEAAGQRRSAVN